MSDLEIADELLVPGDTIAFDFEILTTNTTMRSYVIGKIKDTIWANDMLDYQGSKISTLGDLKLGRDVELLRVFATVRKTRRDTRLEVQQAGLANIVKGVAVVGSILAAYVVFREGKKFLGATAVLVSEIGEATKENMPVLGFVLVAGIVLYVLLFAHVGGSGE
jgi:hypothetical protein